MNSSEEELIKAKIFHFNPEKERMHRSLVLEKKVLSEEEFWKDEPSLKELKKISECADQKLSKSASSLNFKLLESIEGRLDLLRREERLRQKYEKEVIGKKKSEEAF